MVVPKAAHRYMKPVPDTDCTAWTGLKFYGRPVWQLWLQRAVWEEANGPLAPKSRVSETCDMHGCLTLEHLHVTERIPREPRTICRKCGGLLSRDKSGKTYCQMCMKLRARARRTKPREDI